MVVWCTYRGSFQIRVDRQGLKFNRWMICCISYTVCLRKYIPWCTVYTDQKALTPIFFRKSMIGWHCLGPSCWNELIFYLSQKMLPHECKFICTNKTITNKLSRKFSVTWSFGGNCSANWKVNYCRNSLTMWLFQRASLPFICEQYVPIEFRRFLNMLVICLDLSQGQCFFQINGHLL